jgi:hypothetical protein
MNKITINTPTGYMTKVIDYWDDVECLDNDNKSTSATINFYIIIILFIFYLIKNNFNFVFRKIFIIKISLIQNA